MSPYIGEVVINYLKTIAVKFGLKEALNRSLGYRSSIEEIEKAIKILSKASFLEIQRLGYHFQANDFYSPLNDCRFLQNNEDLVWRQVLLSISMIFSCQMLTLNHGFLNVGRLGTNSIFYKLFLCIITIIKL